MCRDIYTYPQHRHMYTAHITAHMTYNKIQARLHGTHNYTHVQYIQQKQVCTAYTHAHIYRHTPTHMYNTHTPSIYNYTHTHLCMSTLIHNTVCHIYTHCLHYLQNSLLELVRNVTGVSGRRTNCRGSNVSGLSLARVYQIKRQVVVKNR